MHEFSGLQNPSSCHWSDEYQKITKFCRKTVPPGFWGTWLYQSTLFDLANTVLASKDSVETICRISVGYRTQRAVTGPMSFKKSRRFVGKPCSRVFGDPGCHPSTLIDLLHTALTSKCLVKTICLISEGYRTHRAVTGPMSFKKSRRFFGKIVLPGFWGTWLYQSTLFDLANTVLASEGPIETICMNSVGYTTHRAVTGPMSFKKITTFCRKIVLPGFWGTWLYQSTLFDLANTVLASKGSVETICLISEG